MRLLFYGLNFAPELVGIGKYSGEMVSWLAERGHSIRVITSPPYYPEWRIHPDYRHRWRRERLGKVEVLRCPLIVPKKQTTMGRIALLASFAIASAPVLLREARRFRPEVVFTVEPTVAGLPTTIAAARLSGARSWVHVQDFEIDSALKFEFLPGPMHRLTVGLERRLLRSFDMVSTISHRMLELLSEKGIPAERSVLFRNWVDTSEIRPIDRSTYLRAELGIPDDAVIALYAGNFGRKQGLEMLAEAISSDSSTKHLTFVFCGFGAAYDSLAAVASKKNIRLLPLQPQSRLNELLNFADIHLLPQHKDSADLVMPSKLAPMLASGRPVVAQAARGSEVATLVEGAGRVVAPTDSVAMVREIESLAADEGERRRLGAVGRERARQHFEKERILLAIESKLHDLVDERRREDGSRVSQPAGVANCGSLAHSREGR